jgi:hypothetical protein
LVEQFMQMRYAVFPMLIWEEENEADTSSR